MSTTAPPVGSDTVIRRMVSRIAAPTRPADRDIAADSPPARGIGTGAAGKVRLGSAVPAAEPTGTVQRRVSKIDGFVQRDPDAVPAPADAPAAAPAQAVGPTATPATDALAAQPAAGLPAPAAAPAFDWNTHPIKPTVEARVVKLEGEYPGIQLGWVVDWLGRFIAEMVASDASKAAGAAEHTAEFEQMAIELAAKMNQVNPQLKVGGGPVAKGVSGGTGTQLWTGGKTFQSAQAEAQKGAEAAQAGGNTEAASVEGTIVGELMNSLSITPSGKAGDWHNGAASMWNEISRQFAANARGTVTVHTVYGVRKPSVFYDIESLGLLKLMVAQEADPASPRNIDKIVMNIFLRKGAKDRAGRVKMVEPESLVKDRTETVTTAKQLEWHRASAWDKRYATDPFFAVKEA